MATLSPDRRRARLGVRHRLARPAATVADAARGVLALHATDPASAFLAAAARVPGATVASIERELYDDRSVVRMLGMRRTVFVVPAELAPVVHAACTTQVAAKERAKLLGFLDQSGIAEPAAWLARVEAATLDALTARGEATAAELARAVPELRTQITVGQGKWVGQQSASTRVLFLLAADGHVVRGRPLGSWLSTQYRWAPLAPWPRLDPADARVELARRWLRAHGPGTVADVAWWAGWTRTQARQALGALPTEPVDVEGDTAYVLADDTAPGPEPPPWVALLPALDPTPMSWQERGWYLGPHRDALFDRSGNIGPTVWCDGRVVGGWAQRRGGEVAYRLLEDVGADAAARIEAGAARLAAWLGDARVTPRFRTPLERELGG
ncbi:MAG: AlkZ family DNA glycosylase [Streptosporangiales bacterium]|nr:AlkZ family DNA glycosylase [Streptosporangiales bacterium]